MLGPRIDGDPFATDSENLFSLLRRRTRTVVEVARTGDGGSEVVTAGNDRDSRQRALDATRALATHGGYNAVQIRDIVRITGLSSATIYRHFSSKDHLIASTHLDWMRLVYSGRRRPKANTTNVDRVVAVLHRVCRSLAASPNLGRALALSLGASDPRVRVCRDESDRMLAAMIRDAIGDEPIDTDEFVRLLGLVWRGALSSWAHGSLAIDEVDRLLQRSARLLVAGATATSD
jgi:TetR/AcrR family transcriptional regulator, cholesterol catabolism regulator